MMFNEDYQSLVRGLSEVDFTGTSIPCKLILIGDSAFPVLVSPAGDVLIAASHYGKGRVVVMAHESYLNSPNLLGFMQNAVSWLKPSAEAVIGVHTGLDLLTKTLQDSGCTVNKISGLTQGLGVMCMDGYDDSQAKDIISFLYEGGGLLIAAQAWYWSYSHKNENVLLDFPGNKIISVSGIYFRDVYGERGTFTVSPDIPHIPMFSDISFLLDLNILLKDIALLDIRGSSTPSELLLHGPLTFPVGLNDENKCFLAAAIYGRGRIVVGTHETLFTKPELKTVILNSILWLGSGRKQKIGVNKAVKGFTELLMQEGFDSSTSSLEPGLSVYCCDSYSDSEAERIKKFVAEGGGLLIAGQSWYWSYKNPEKNVVCQYPGNKILNTFGISILGKSIGNGAYKPTDPAAVTNYYHFPRAFSQLLKNLQDGVEIQPPLSSWLTNIREDASNFMRLPASPLTYSIQQECVCLVKRCGIPNVSKDCPVKNNSKDALILSLAHDVCCFNQNSQSINNFPFKEKPSVTVEIDGTNPGTAHAYGLIALVILVKFIYSNRIYFSKSNAYKELLQL
ncbi:Hypothetical predicted protein [Pelobates cultripes]|uniref:Peptidase M60 domain-containing protein n=1 Tax=Pelobates cultripes TaxID=61616 RepID=A0AAD1RN22_PELCU|nr:Hypothetical predicted protein [Pelobates cultripes]